MAFPMRRLNFTALFLVILTAACTPRAAIHLVPDAANIGTVQSIFVGSSRTAGPPNDFSPDRDPDLTLATYDVSVPPTHSAGMIELTRGSPDPVTDFVVSEVTDFAGPRAFSAELRKSLRMRPRGKRTVTVFVHGYNSTFADGLYRQAQLMNDFGFDSVAVHYSWPSAGNPLGYAHDRDSTLFARDGLEQLLKMVKAAGADNVLLLAHSVGGHLTMETLRQMEIAKPGSAARTLSAVVLISPDIDVGVFRKQVSRMARLPDPFVIFASDRDRALQLSARLTGQTERLGTITDANELSDLDIILFDVSDFSEGPSGHFNTARSPELILILKLLPGIEDAFRRDRAGRAGFIPGTILTVRNATQVVLVPLSQ